MDYKAMWEELKEKLCKDLKFYENGMGCSWGEAVHGATHTKDVLYTMATIESGHKVKETKMDNSNYVLVTVGHERFYAGKLVLVRISEEYSLCSTYRDEAFRIACLKLGLTPSDCKLLDWQFLGDDLTFIL